MAASSGCSSVLGNAPSDRILTTYRAGYSSYRTGTEIHNEAVIAYRSDEYGTVQSKISEALPTLKDAMASFRDSRDLAADHGLDDAETIGAAAIEKTSLLIEAATLLGETAHGFATEEYERAQQAYDTYRDRMAAFRETRMYSPQQLDEVLDTGFFGF